MKHSAFLISWVAAVSMRALIAAPAVDRPNILFAFADDWGKYASAYADLEPGPGPNAVIKTPNFDRVAREGVLFTNAFVTSPSCTPCRSSLLSGQYFFRTGRGAILSGAEWDASIPSYPLLLRDQAGYHIGQTYKVWSPGTPRDAPYGEREHEYESAGSRFNQFSQNVTAMVEQGKSIAKAKQTLYDEVLANFDSFLEARPEGQPFCYWFGPTNVHRKWIQGSGKKLWGLDPDSLKGKMPKFLPDVHDIREDFADYLGEAMAFDAALGVLLKKLKELGELDNTLVVVSGDHGVPGFPHGKTNLYDFGTNVALAARWPRAVPRGRVVTDFVNLMDLAPTFLETGGVEPPEVMTGKSIVNLLKSKKDGRIDLARNHVVTGRERHVANARSGNLPYPHRALRTDDFLYIRNFKPNRWPEGNPFGITSSAAPKKQELVMNTGVSLRDVDAGPTKAWLVLNRKNKEARGAFYYHLAFGKRPLEELYDLKADPDQMVNLAENPDYTATREELAAQLIGILETAGDPRVTEKGDTFDKPPFTNLPPTKRGAKIASQAKPKPDSPKPKAGKPEGKQPEPTLKPKAKPSTGKGKANQPVTISDVFRSRDRNKDGKLTLQEFMGNSKGKQAENLKTKFRELDRDKDGVLVLRKQGPPKKPKK